MPPEPAVRISARQPAPYRGPGFSTRTIPRTCKTETKRRYSAGTLTPGVLIDSVRVSRRTFLGRRCLFAHFRQPFKGINLPLPRLQEEIDASHPVFMQRAVGLRRTPRAPAAPKRNPARRLLKSRQPARPDEGQSRSRLSRQHPSWS